MAERLTAGATKFFWMMVEARGALLSSSPRDIFKFATTMIRRALLRQSRAVGSSTASSSRLSRATFQPCLSQKSFAARPPASFAASRLYSTEPEASKASESNAEPEGQQADAADPMKLELEKKDKEILELKVRCASLGSSLHFRIAHCHRTSTSVRLQTSGISRSAQHET